MNTSTDADLFPALVFEAGVPQAQRIPMAPDALATFVRQYFRGCVRLVVKLQHGRKRFSQLNSIFCGGSFDRAPECQIDDLVRAIMAVAQDAHEERGESCNFMVQAYWQGRATGEPTRKSVFFALGDLDDWGSAPIEDLDDPSKVDEAIFSHLRHAHDHILKQSKIIQEIGQTAIASAGEVFRARSEALELQGKAQAELALSAADRELETLKEKRIDRLMATAEQVLPLVVGKMGGASDLGGLPTPQLEPPAAVPQPLSAAPTWTTPKPQAIGPKTSPAPEGDSVAQMQNQPTLAKVRKLWDSLSSDQWGAIAAKLSKSAINHLRKAREAKNDLDALPHLQRFDQALKPDQALDLAGLFGPEQRSTMVYLRQRVEDFRDSQAPDSTPD